MSQCEDNGLTKEETAKIKGFIKAQEGVEGALIPVLHEAQESFGYIPYAAQRLISEEMNIPIAKIYGVITFYSRFTLQPTGKYKVAVCMGTACYVKGSEMVLDKVQKCLNVRVGESSADGKFSVESTRCIGACGLAPVLMVNDSVYGKVTPDDVPNILAKYE